MHPRLVLPPVLTGRPFTVSDGLAEGLSRGDLRSRQLRRPWPGVRVDAASPDTLAQRCTALALLVPRGEFTGATALGLLGLPIPGDLDPAHPVVVDIGLRGGRVRHRGVRVVRESSDPPPLVTDGQLAIAETARVWEAVAGDGLGLQDLVVVGDALARHRGGLAALESARPPSASAARALSLVRHPVDSPPETLVRLALIEAGLPEPLVNIAVYDASGGWVARPDLAWPEVKTAVEYDGAHHREQPQWVRDLRRRECLEDAGWRVLVATAHDLGSLPAFTMRVASTLAERGLRWRGAPVH